jgi:hypothetical protein
MLLDVVAAEYLDGFSVKVTFEDGLCGIVDLSEYIARGGVFSRLSTPDVFRRFIVDRELGTLCWDGDIDIAPETLYEEALKHKVTV